ncbi:MAG TPA: DEAD/DEAH box helicase [Phaeodactylibacter sp.]|nr:DEAD/DEAH box helicase [Phaeodactylibacter sp.]
MTSFQDLGLSPELIQTISKMGFETPTPIQVQAIPLLLQNETDLVGLAQTGTGKTAAFGLPLIELIDTTLKQTQALVVAPTRELCLQISKEFELFSRHLPKLHTVAVYGGADIYKQIKQLKRGAHIIVATPGRLRDLLRRKAVDISHINYIILDEADEMLNMGFKEEIDDILSNTSEDKLTWLFSATMPKEVRRIAKEYMTDPAEVSVRGKQITNVNIEHQYVKVYPSARFETLKRFLDYNRDTFGLVFCRTRRECKELVENLGKDGYNADALHGDLSQAQRDQVMARFRSKRLQVLIATDVAARGLDVQDITHVFHFNIPDDYEVYTHRSGRTARAGKKGKSIILMHPNDAHILRQLEKRNNISFSPAHIPTGEEICELQVLNYIRRLRESEVSPELEPFMDKISQELQELSKMQIIEKLAALSFNRFLEKYRLAPDLNQHKRAKKEFSKENMHCLYINMGHMDLENKGQLLGFICKHGGINGSQVGKIKVNRTHSYFDVVADVADKVKANFKNVQRAGRDIRVNDGEPFGKTHTQRKKKKKKFKKKKKNR